MSRASPPNGCRGLFFWSTVARTGALTVVLTAACTPERASFPVCTFVYGGERVVREFTQTADPYAPAPSSIDGRFTVRGVYLTQPRKFAAFNLYVFAELDSGPTLLTQLDYRPPFHARQEFDPEVGFTGKHRVYAPNDRELEFWCNWGSP